MSQTVEVVSGAALGFLGLASVDEAAVTVAPSPEKAMLYATAGLLGGSLGGGLMGLLSSSDTRGAQTGAFFGAGMTGLVNAVALTRAGQTALGALFGIVGLAGVSGAVYMAATRQRGR